MAQLPPIPTDSDVIEGKPGTLSTDYYTWFYDLWVRILNIAFQPVPPVARVGLTVSIAPTGLAVPAGAGTFRISAYVRVTTPAGVASSIAVTLQWLDNGVAQTKTLIAALAGNTTATYGENIATIQADAGSISYSTTYASNPASAMVYKLFVTAEQLL